MANMKLKIDSPVSRNIVLAFLDFLKSVEPAPGADLEGLEVVKECLEEVFKLNSSSTNDPTQPGLLVEYFKSLDANKQHNIKQEQHQTTVPDGTPSTSSTLNVPAPDLSAASETLVEDAGGESHAFDGGLKDELFGQFLCALEKIHFLDHTSEYNDDHDQLDKTTKLFHDALLELERSGCQINATNLADTFKSQGNKAMQSKLYYDAVELYTYAIALCADNAVYYCNRAAAYTQIDKFEAAIRDCLKSIDISPSYSKAYSRLGLAYYAQGNYSDAINKGFIRALQLDPNSDSVRENIRVAEERLKEEMQRRGHGQNAGSTSHSNQEPRAQSTGGSRNGGPPPPFTSFSFNAGSLPSDLTNMFMNMAGSTFQGQQHAQDRPHGGSNTGGVNEPEIRMGGNVNVEFGEEIPEELMGTWRSVMGMFSGAQSNQHQQDDAHRGGQTPPN